MTRLAAMLMIAATTTAIAHSPEHFAQAGKDNENWLRGLKNEKGTLCCDGKDGFDAIYDTKDGNYRVLLFGIYWVVPDDRVIKQPNRLGVAQVWYTTLWKTEGPFPQIRCFIPGSGI